MPVVMPPFTWCGDAVRPPARQERGAEKREQDQNRRDEHADHEAAQPHAAVAVEPRTGPAASMRGDPPADYVTAFSAPGLRVPAWVSSAPCGRPTATSFRAT